MIDALLRNSYEIHMTQEWKQVASGFAIDRAYTVEAQELNGKIYVRVLPGDGSFRLLDGAYDTYEDALLMAHELVPELIQEIVLNESGKP